MFRRKKSWAEFKFDADMKYADNQAEAEEDPRWGDPNWYPFVTLSGVTWIRTKRDLDQEDT